MEDKKPILFSVDDKNYVYTLKFVKDEAFRSDMIKNIVKLDEGAYKPILNGANIMAPGIYKYKNEIETYNKGDYVYVSINNEFVAIGVALLGLSGIDDNAKGPAVEVIHCVGDALYTLEP